MKVLAIDTVLPDANAESIRTHFMREVHQLVKLYLADAVREIYFRQDRSGVVLVLEVPGLDEARSLLNTLPLVQEKLIAFELIPLGPFMPLALLLDETANDEDVLQ